MPRTSLRSVTASLGLHALLLAAAHDAARAPRRAPDIVTARLESAIVIEALGAAGDRLTPTTSTTARHEDTPPVASSSLVPPASAKRVAPRAAAANARARLPAATQMPPLSPPTTPPTALAPAEPATLPRDDGALDAPATVAKGPALPPSTSGRGPSSMDVGPTGVSSRSTGGSGSARAAAEGSTNAGYARLLAGYLSGARERVARHREYPYLARRANLEGTVCLRIVVAASGRVLGVTPTCGTAHRPLLEAALDSVAKAAPFPPLPASLGSRITFDVPVVFELEQL
jgi:periplasmic protein TonB